MEEEIFKPTHVSPKYLVSNTGKVLSLRSGRLLRGNKIGKGYVQVNIHARMFLVHRLVAIAFIPNSDGTKKEINHMDANKLNNSASNLEWVSRSENIRHAQKLGLLQRPTLRGHLNHKSKLTPQDVIEMRDLYSKWDLQLKELSKIFGISVSCCSRVIRQQAYL